MKLTKEECLNAYEELEFSLCELEEIKTGVDTCCIFDGNLDVFKNLIDEHFDNPPLKFEELEEDMWVWDIEWCQFRKLMDAQDFEENRFYRKQVEE